MNPSLRSRLLWFTGLGGAGLLLAASFSLYAMFRASLLSAFDADLRQRCQTLARLIENENGDPEVEFDEADLPEFSRADRPEYYELRDSIGAAIAWSASLTDGLRLPPDAAADEIGSIRPLVLPDGRAGRCCTIRFTPRVDPSTFTRPAEISRLELAVARDTRDVAAALMRLGRALALVGGASLALGLAALAAIIHLGLRPVGRVAESIAALDVHRLSDRVDPAQAPLELQPIVARLNEMLERVSQAFSREKALTADIAHELRNPLAGIIATLEVALARPREAAAYRESIERALDVARGTSRLVESLLTLARLDADRARDGSTNGPPKLDQSTDVAALCRSEWDAIAARGNGRTPRADWRLATDLRVRRDSDHLRILVRNLLENAAGHSPRDSSVEIRASTANGDLVLDVSNPTNPDQQPDASRVFERFYRADAARPAEGGHYGIGLALCKAIVESMNGEIRAELNSDRRFSVHCRIPANP